MRQTIDPNKVAIYIRWSTDDQSEGTTLETQRDACLYYARSQGWIVPDERIFIDDGYSGGNLNRPGISRIRELVSEGKIQCVVIYKIDRLSRNIVDATGLVLDEWEGSCYLKCVMEPIDTTQELGRVIFSILATFADFERSQIKTRTFGGKIKRAAQGRNPGGRVPYGYKRGAKRGDVLIDENQATVVRRIFDLFAAGNGIRTIAHILNSEGIPAHHGGTWGRTSLRKIIGSSKYIGRWSYGVTRRNERSKHGDGPKRVRSETFLAEADRTDLAIISQEVWDKCCAIQRETRDALETTSGRALASEHLLSGLVKCRCGHPMRIDVDNHKGKPYIAFRCSGRTSKGPSFCDCGRVREEILNAAMEEWVLRLRQPNIMSIVQANIRKRWDEELRHVESQLAQNEKRTKELETELASIARDYRAQKLDVDTFNSLRQDIRQELEQASRRRDQFTEKVQRLRTDATAGDMLMDTYSHLNEWESLTTAQKKAILRNLVNKITVYRKVNSTEPLSIEIEAKGIDAETVATLVDHAKDPA